MVNLFGKDAEKLSRLNRRIKTAMERRDFWNTRLEHLVKAKVNFRLEKKWKMEGEEDHA